MSSKQEKPSYIPTIKTPKEVKERTLRVIKAEASGHQLGLKTRFASLNVGMGKYFRFKQVYSFAGPSGHGKSMLLNLLIQDFTNPELNMEKCYYDYIICHHGFEMTPEDEELRKVSGKIKVSYNHLLSSEFDRETGRYNKISEQEFNQIKSVLEEDGDKPIYYFDEPCELLHIGHNVRAAIDHYKQKVFADKERLYRLIEKLRRQEPNNPKYQQIPERWEDVPTPKVVITIDHTLLIKPSPTEFDLLQMMRNLAKTAIALKKLGYMVIFLNQFNNNIEKSERMRTPELQFPIKSDVYAQGEIFNACDGVFTIYQPELMGIEFYGKNQYHTHNLVHLQALKMRFGKVGSVWLQNELEKGLLTDYPRAILEANMKSKKTMQ